MIVIEKILSKEDVSAFRQQLTNAPWGLTNPHNL